MIDDRFILRVERLRDAVEELRVDIRHVYRNGEQQVRSEKLRASARELAETWMVEIAPVSDVKAAIEPEVLAELAVKFQRILTVSERSALRRKYDAVITGILKDFR